MHKMSETARSGKSCSLKNMNVKLKLLLLKMRCDVADRRLKAVS